MKAGRRTGGTTLNPQQELFCQEYLKDLNGQEAYKRAGYTAKSDVIAKANASRLLATDPVQDRIAELAKARSKRIGLEADRVLLELAYIALSDVGDLFDENGKMLEPKAWPRRTRRAVASVEVDELFDFDNGRKVQIGYTKKVKFWPKVPALELLGKHQKLFINRHEHEVGKTTLEQLLEASRKTTEGEET